MDTKTWQTRMKHPITTVKYTLANTKIQLRCSDWRHISNDYHEQITSYTEDPAKIAEALCKLSGTNEVWYTQVAAKPTTARTSWIERHEDETNENYLKRALKQANDKRRQPSTASISPNTSVSKAAT